MPMMRTLYAHNLTSSSAGPTTPSDAAKLHWWNARTWSGANDPTTLCSTPRLWKRTRSFSRQSCGYTNCRSIMIIMSAGAQGGREGGEGTYGGSDSRSLHVV